jgi:hypothetical protein
MAQGGGGAGRGGSSSGGSEGTAGSSSGGQAGSGGQTGGQGGSSGGGGSGGSPEQCTPASTAGIAYSGTCTTADVCSEQYDVTFTPQQLQQLCEGQSGTYSMSPCNPSEWDIKCTQAVLGGVYIHHMMQGGICFQGCEEAL